MIQTTTKSDDVQFLSPGHVQFAIFKTIISTFLVKRENEK